MSLHTLHKKKIFYDVFLHIKPFFLLPFLVYSIIHTKGLENHPLKKICSLNINIFSHIIIIYGLCDAFQVFCNELQPRVNMEGSYVP